MKILNSDVASQQALSTLKDELACTHGNHKNALIALSVVSVLQTIAIVVLFIL
jgi:hypothetical protein